MLRIDRLCFFLLPFRSIRDDWSLSILCIDLYSEDYAPSAHLGTNRRNLTDH
jgi:hypothetical protein